MDILHNLGIEWQALLVNIVGFLLLLWFFRRFLFRPISDFMASRSEEIEHNIDEARRMHAEAEQERDNLRQELEHDRGVARDQIARMTQEAKAAIEELQRDARRQRQEMIELGRAELERSKDVALAEIKKDITDIVLAASERVIRSSINEERHEALLQSFLDDIEKAGREDRLN